MIIVVDAKEDEEGDLLTREDREGVEGECCMLRAVERVGEVLVYLPPSSPSGGVMGRTSVRGEQASSRSNNLSSKLTQKLRFLPSMRFIYLFYQRLFP